MKSTLLLVLFCFAAPLSAAVWRVGAGRLHTVPSAVSSLVADSDTVLIDEGTYIGDVCSWRAHNLLLRGEGGHAKLAAGGKSAEQKAIWVIKGDNAIVENIEFSDCVVPDHNGAGIRQEGTNLIVRNCAFRRNEMGLLAGNNIRSTIIVEYSEFERSGYGDGYSHNIYINHIYRFVFRYNYSHQAFIGHECKSRAHRNEILYNRLSNEDGRASREIDLPNGGFSIVMGNIVHQGQNAENSNIIGYGLEGLSDSLQNELYVASNTIVNDKPIGTFVQAQTSSSRVMIRNNFFVGAGTIFSGSTHELDTGNNVRSNLVAAGFASADNYDYHLTATSPAISAAHAIAPIGAHSLMPSEEYRHPANKQPADHPLEAIFDAGAYQFEQVNIIGNTENNNEVTMRFTYPKTLLITAKNEFAYKIWNMSGKLISAGNGCGDSRIQIDNEWIIAVEVKTTDLLTKRLLLAR